MKNLIDKKKPVLMIADGNRKNRELVAEFLKSRSYKIILAGNNKEVIEKLKKEVPAVILLDINLPEISGIELCKKLKASESTKNIPVIFITKKISRNNIIKIFQAGGAEYIQKPVTKINLEKTITFFMNLKKVKK